MPEQPQELPAQDLGAMWFAAASSTSLPLSSFNKLFIL